MADGPLFIVDNGASGRNGLDYLREWSELASSIDIATGFFEIGSLLDLDGHWQKFDKIRILMGDEISHRTKKALLVAVKQRAQERLDESIEDDKERDPFLPGIEAIWAALASGQIECRVYNKDKFHAKAYLSAGLMAELRRRGDRVVVVTATLGEHGTSEPAARPPERLAALRTLSCAPARRRRAPRWGRASVSMERPARSATCVDCR